MSCPNKNSKEFKQMVEALGEDLTYYLIDKNNGNPIQFAPNGKPSILYNTLLKELSGLQDIKVNNDKFDSTLNEELYNKFRTLFKKLYPGVKVKEVDNIEYKEGAFNQIDYILKAVNILQSDKAKQIFKKGEKNGWSLDKILTELQIPKLQKELILEKGLKDREGIITSLLAENSFVVEIKIPQKIEEKFILSDGTIIYKENGEYIMEDGLGERSRVIHQDAVLEILEAEGIDYYYDDGIIKHRKNGTDFYKNLTVPGGTNYTENEIRIPSIVPNILGHPQFSTKNGIGWFRSDDNEEINSIRRILEIQSDLFQKGRDKKDLITSELEYLSIKDDIDRAFIEKDGKYYFHDEFAYIDGGEEWVEISKEQYDKRYDSLDKTKTAPNRFLQLLNKKSNWVNFFIQAVVQDSAKKGYKKVRFPLGETAAKIEGHQLIADKIKTIDNQIEDIEKELENGYYVSQDEYENLSDKEQNIISSDKMLKDELEELKAEKQKFKSQGLEKLAPIEHFYQNVVAKKVRQFYGKDVEEITGEYGNKWLEVTIKDEHKKTIFLQKPSDNILGQYDLKAKTILINARLQKSDTLPHEYAHHYIRMFYNTPIVQEGIKRFGSEEALVQAIGGQAVKQKGEAWNWWKKFVNWLLNKMTDEELLQVLTDSFLTGRDLSKDSYNIETKALQTKAKIYTKEFIEWFGDWKNNPENVSKVVDENGEPLLEEIKSATDNKGIFSKTDDNIYNLPNYHTVNKKYTIGLDLNKCN